MNSQGGDQDLELRIRTEKDSFAVGETIELEIILRNTGSRMIRAPKYFMLPADEPKKNTLQILVGDAAGTRLRRISSVLTGRALYYPELQLINPGGIYSDFIQLAGTFVRRHGRVKEELALWCFGENPEVTSGSEYPAMIEGTYKIQAIYNVDREHLVSLDEADKSGVWQGRLLSNIIEIRIYRA